MTSPQSDELYAKDDTSPACSYVDFIPPSIRDGKFSQLILLANQWLAANPELEVVSCESTETKIVPGKSVKNDESTFYESGTSLTWFVRMVRVWFRPRKHKDGPGPTQIGYVNVVPECKSEGDSYNAPEFATFRETITSINAKYKTTPLPGKIITVEVVDVKFSRWGNHVDPDATFWAKDGDSSTYFLNMIRICYKQGPPVNELIGTIDFVPSGKNEQYASLMEQANQWLQRQKPMNIISMQSVDYKTSKTWDGSDLDTDANLYHEDGYTSTYFVRILRMTFLINDAVPAVRNSTITYRSFEPYRIDEASIGYSMGRYETLSQTMARAQAFLKVTGVNVISAETVSMVMGTMSKKHNSLSETTYTKQSGNTSNHFLLCFRLYFDQAYTEPPAEMLPPVPVPPPLHSTVTCCML